MARRCTGRIRRGRRSGHTTTTWPPAPPSGVVDRRIALPVEKPTMPAFGGGEMRTLFVTSIGDGGSYPQTPGQRDAGGLFAIETGSGGPVATRFRLARGPRGPQTG